MKEISMQLKNMSQEQASELVIRIIKNILIIYGNQHQGFKKRDRLKYYDICDALESHDPTLTSVCLENKLYDFLVMCKENGMFTPDDMFRQVEHALDNAKEINA